MTLLDRIRSRLQPGGPLATDRFGASTDTELRAATAVLLLEAAYGDTEYVWSEHRAIVRGLERAFGLGRQETLELLGQAEEIRPPVVALADVTGLIRERFSEEQRRQVVRLVWEVIAADDVVIEWEAVFADHIAHAVGIAPEEARALRARPADRAGPT